MTSTMTDFLALFAQNFVLALEQVLRFKPLAGVCVERQIVLNPLAELQAAALNHPSTHRSL